MIDLAQNILPQLSDEQLANHYRLSGDVVYFNELCKRYIGILRGVCYRYFKITEEAQDQAQNVFLEIYEKEKIQNTVDEIENFGSWIYIVTLNYCLDVLKSRRYKDNKNISYIDDIEIKFKQLEADGMHSAGFNRLDEILQNEEKFLKLENCLEELPAEQKECITKFYLEKHSYKTIAEQMHFEKEEVRSYIQNGRRNLAIRMENNR